MSYWSILRKLFLSSVQLVKAPPAKSLSERHRTAKRASRSDCLVSKAAAFDDMEESFAKTYSWENPLPWEYDTVPSAALY